MQVASCILACMVGQKSEVCYVHNLSFYSHDSVNALQKTVSFQFIQVRRVFSQNTILNAGDALSLLIIFIPNYRKEKL